MKEEDIPGHITQSKDFKLQTLLDITKAINSNDSTRNLLGLFDFNLRHQLGISKYILFSNNSKEWKPLLKQGTKGVEKKFAVEKDLLHIKEITVIESSSKEHLNDFDVIIPVYHKSYPLAYLLIGKTEPGEAHQFKDQPFIQTLTNITIVAIENKRLAKESLKRERMNRELELASEMQNMLFPSILPDNDRLQIAAYYQPHHQVGGDYYDYIPLNEQEAIFCMADVSGKGVSAALLMANFQAGLRAIVKYRHVITLTEIAEELNHKVMLNAKGEKFITLFLAKYNVKTRLLTYITAAHNPPLLKSGSSITPLDQGCTGLGMFDKLPEVQEGQVNIPPQSMLVCYTDGVVELENPQGKEYGSERLEELILSAQSSISMKEFNALLLKDLEQFKENCPYIDDVALFTCRFF